MLDLSGSDPELLSSGRIPDRQPEHTPLCRWLAGALGALEEFLRAAAGPLRVGIRTFWGVIAAVGVCLLVGPIIKKPIDCDGVFASAENEEVGWLLLSSTVWLTPEGETADGVRYACENDDSLSLNSDVWVFASCEEGTFSQPPETTLLWVQAFGPLIPLARLTVTALCGLVALHVVWADSAGAPWCGALRAAEGDCPRAFGAAA